MTFIINWVIFYIAITFAMCIDNLFWIGASAEYEYFKKIPTFKKKKGHSLEIDDKHYYTKFSYIFKYRVKSVITHWRDIIPGIITSFILTVVTRII